MLQHPSYTRARVAQLRDRFRSRIWPRVQMAEKILVSGSAGRISFDEAVRLNYKPAKLGQQFGPLFASYWFRVTITVPQDWKGSRVDLLWTTHSENTLWIDGRSIQGLNDSSGQNRTDATLIDKAKGGEQLTLHLEMACNDAFGNGGKQWPEHRSPVFLDRCELGAFDPLAWDIYHDLNVLHELEVEQDRPGQAGWAKTAGGAGDLDPTWGGKLLFELNRFANVLDEDDRGSWPKAQKILKDLLATRNGDCVHNLSAIGHAHIDTAWLWPLAETHRKCERSFSTATTYMAQYPEYKFSCSQAYQYDVIRRRNPDLYKRIRKFAKKGQWVPVGGTWIEPDCNIPSGESLIRQFLFGQRFFEKEFGRRCNEFWNPDVFGYNGQLPQILSHCGVNRFLTQKLSWNYFNKPMHQTFYWEGIDGSRVLAHFPPADTYNGDCSIKQLRKHASSYKDNMRSREAIYLFGYGDGGGGPTRGMIETLRRCKDLQGVPRCEIRSSDEFFDRLERDIQDVPVVIGELYFELHRGTYTTQARTKRGNRKSEILLHDTELLSVLASRMGKFRYPQKQINDLWEIVLLNQFHDILPGSSIRHVYEDAERHYAEVEQQGKTLRDQAVTSLGEGLGGKPSGHAPINTISFDRREVAQRPDGELVFVAAPSMGVGVAEAASDQVKVKHQGKRFVLENAKLRATLASDGRLLSLLHKATGREALAEPGNVLEIAIDKPTMWEAWDVDPWLQETAQPCAAAESSELTREDPLRAEVTFKRTLGDKSPMTTVVRLDAGADRLEFHCEVDWQERQRMIKAAFPMNIRAMNATYEMQYGTVERPTHTNDLLALAKFEVPMHRWADLSETGFGVALLNDCKYGMSTAGNTMRLSLLRGTTAPDPDADRGHHVFSYAIYPHAERWEQGQVVAEAMRFNHPLLWAPGEVDEPRSFFTTRSPMDALVLDTVKKAEDGNGIVLRFYESLGSRGTAEVRLDLPAESATYCNGLEDDGDPARLADGVLTLPYRPYEVISVKLA